MKKQRLFGYFSGFLLSLSLFSGSCTKSTTDDSLPVSVSNRLTADKELLAFLGYDTSDLIRLDTCYIVEGDICITDRLITDIRNARRTRHTYSQWPHTVQEKYRTIRIGIEGTSIDRSIVSDALRYWNEEIKCGLYFLEDTPYDTKIEFTSSTNPAGGVESAEPPTSDGKPGSKINVFYQSSAYFQANATQKKYLIVHALGHTVGFGHTPATLAEYTAIPPGSQIRGTIDYDPKSIMVKPASTLKWSGVSKFDKEAFQKFYPYTAPALSMDRTPYDREFVCNKPYTFRAYYTNDPQCPDPEFEFTVTSESTENASWQIKDNGIMQIIFPAQGTYRIKVAVTNAPSRPEITEVVEIIIYDNEPTLTITPTEPIEIGKTYRLHVSYNNPNAGTNPVYDYTIKDSRFGNKAKITPVDNASCDVVFTHPGEYEVRASLRSDNKIQTPPLSLPVYSKEIVVSCGALNTHTDAKLNAFYYSAAHPAGKLKFTISKTPDGTRSYLIKNVKKDNIDICFYKEGQYTLRVEIEDSPEIYTEQALHVLRYLGLKGVTITPEERIQTRKAYRLYVDGDISVNPGVNPDYYFTIEDRLFGNRATLTKIDNRSSDVIFTLPGEYIVTAWLGKDGLRQGSLALSVYSGEISIQQIYNQIFGENKGSYGFIASYYSDIHSDPEFRFTIIEPDSDAVIRPISHSLKNIESNRVDYWFHVAGDYILRAEVAGAPDIYIEYPFKVTTTADIPILSK